MRTPRSLRRRATTATVAALLLVMASGSGALAGRPDTVDPGLMTPPLNPSFTWECWRAGDQIVCDGERVTTYEAVEAIPCDDGWIYATGIARDTLRRVGDADGRALTTLGTTRIDDLVSRSPAFDGIVGRARGSWTDLFEYAVPGDLSTRTVTRRGVDVILTVPGKGMIVLDAGVKSWDIEDNILFARGPHDLVEDIDGAFARACDALAGGSS